MSTHLGNGAHATLPRHPNYLWEQLADDRLTASIIADGHHLPAAVVKCVARVKGPERLCLVSDAIALSPNGDTVKISEILISDVGEDAELRRQAVQAANGWYAAFTHDVFG